MATTPRLTDPAQRENCSPIKPMELMRGCRFWMKQISSCAECGFSFLTSDMVAVFNRDVYAPEHEGLKKMAIVGLLVRGSCYCQKTQSEFSDNTL